MKSLTMALYPNTALSLADAELDEYFNKIKNIGATEIFTSIHQPEYSLSKQLKGLIRIAQYAFKNNLQVSVDIGGHHFYDILNSKEKSKLFDSSNVKIIRLDYGFDLKLLEKFILEFSINTIILNASILSEEELKSIINFRNINFPDLDYKASFNFYPREETGMNLEFAQDQYKIFNKYNIFVEACVPTPNNPRGPLYKGLPTIESHRNQPIAQSMIELYEENVCDGFLFGDDILSQSDIEIINQVYNNKKLDLQYSLLLDVNDIKYLDLIEDKYHHFRIDSNEILLRSQSSREMAEQGPLVKEQNTIKREKGVITIDNELYGRYSGEIQIVLTDLPADSRINVIGKISASDLWKLKYFRNGYLYKFVR